MKQNNAVIELKNIWKTYSLGETVVHAIKDMSVKIRKGEFIAIIGPSGAGKSTCINMVGCLDIPTKGAVYLDRQDISAMTESELAQIRGRKIGFIFQQFNLIGTLSAAENVMLPMLFQDVPKEQREQRAQKLLSLVGLGDRTDHRPTELSGGQQQRVAIARALANDPEVLLADEPTGNLDSKTGKLIIEFLKDINKKGKTLIIVTHDMNLAKQAKRVIHIKDGQILKETRRTR